MMQTCETFPATLIIPETISPQKAVTATKKLWIESPAWDLFWIFPAIWLSLLLFFLDEWMTSFPLFFLTFAALERGLALVHSWSTIYLVMGSSLFRPLRKKKPVRYLVVPAAIFLSAVLLGLAIARWQRFPKSSELNWNLWPFMLYIGSFYVGHFWHFGRQDFGVLSLYRNRAKQTRPIDRQIDLGYMMLLMYLVQPLVYFHVLATTPFSEIFLFFLPLSAHHLEKAALGAVLVTCLAGSAITLFELAKENRSIPKLLYYGVMAAHPILLFYGGIKWGLYYVVTYLWSHWFIASALSARLNVNYQLAQGRARWHSRGCHALIVGGIAGLLWLITRHFTRYHIINLGDFEYKEVLAALTPGEWIIAGSFMGLFLGEQLLHYYCDRHLFRFKDPAVRGVIGKYF